MKINNNKNKWTKRSKQTHKKNKQTNDVMFVEGGGKDINRQRMLYCIQSKQTNKQMDENKQKN